MKKPSEDEFDVTESRITHRPTGAWWGVTSDFRSAEPDGDEYDYEEVEQMALMLRARFLATHKTNG